jgi:hypothetical protein
MKHAAMIFAAFAMVSHAQNASLPHIQKNGAATQMIVDGKPFLMLAGELHNSSASSVEYMKPIWNRLAELHLNTVIGTVSWELLEPREGNYDFSLVDAQIREARQRNMRLVLIWFATWKNADSTYVPLWVKTNLSRFPRMQRKDGSNMEELTPFGAESLKADARAYAALMRHIREVDPQHTVIMMQVENETGILGDSRDHSPAAESAWSKPVPAELTNYLAGHKATLGPEVLKEWGASGFKSSGTWPEVFGTGPHAEEIFMAWYVGSYVNQVAAAGKAELNIPMYANAWLVQNDTQLPGGYPSGGPVSRVMDIWRAAAPSLDLLAPDIYLPDFKAVCASYAQRGNPLFIPEARAIVANAFWAIGQHAALGFSPFGIDDLGADHPLGRAYKALGGLAPVLLEYQTQGKVIGAMPEGGTQTALLGGYRLSISQMQGRRFGAPPPAAGPRTDQPESYGLIAWTGPDEFLIVGSGISVAFAPDSPGPKVAALASIEEGLYEAGRWLPGRRLNGDEFHPSLRSGQIGEIKVRLYRHD